MNNELQNALSTRLEALRERLPMDLRHFERAGRLIPRGMTRTRLWDPYPLYITQGNRSNVTDLDGNKYVDCKLVFGTFVLGHSHPRVVQVLTPQMSHGLHFGAGCVQESD